MNLEPVKLLTTLQELLFFYQLLQTGDRGDKSDSNKYLRALTEGVMPDLLTYVGWNSTFFYLVNLTFLNMVNWVLLGQMLTFLDVVKFK